MGRNNFSIIINEENIINNYNYIKDLSKKEIISVIKSNAYSHGTRESIIALSKAGCKYFAVAREEEVMEILNLGLDLKNITILVLETLSNLNLLKKYDNVEMVINSIEELEEFIDLKLDFSKLHLKLDFGFGRNGIYSSQIIKAKELIVNNNLFFKGITTHMFDSTSEEIKSIQMNFLKTIEFLGNNRFSMIHSENSATTLTNGHLGPTHVRCGISLLGLLDPGINNSNIKRSWRLLGSVYHIRNVENLSYIGYENIKNLNFDGYKFVAKLKIGYGDGFSKSNTNIICHINNKPFKIIHVSMDTTFVAIDETVSIGDIVEIYKDMDYSNEYLNMPHYEYITLINKRIERKLLKNPNF